MTGTDAKHETTARAGGAAPTVDMKLEVVVLGVTDVDRARDFYVSLGWRLDADFPGPDGFRVVQVTPPGSPTSVIFGSKLTTAEPGSADSVMLVVDDIEAARAALVARGADVSEVFHDADGVFHRAGTDNRVPGPAPERGSYGSFASFSDPDGNGWMLQEITKRLPGRVGTDVATLATLLHETAEHHDPFEKAAAPHDWWDWYAAYLDARLQGSPSEEANAVAGRYMAEVKGVRVK